MYKRYLNINLPKGQSAFLWGARKTGKSTYLKRRFPDSIYYDLLKSDAYLKYSKQPSLFRQEVLALTPGQLEKPIIIDEVQKIPKLLDEIHWLIENSDAYFILCGSSARSLRRKGVNLLGGRAWSFHFYPLVYKEIDDFDLLKVFYRGTIPSHYVSENYRRFIKAYVEDYLTQEIQMEGLVRNLPAFARFLDCIGFSNGAQINYSNIARDVGVDAKTIKEYFQILIDTLLGYYIFPFKKHIKRDIITSIPKFYLFDVGVASYLSKMTEKPSDLGHAFEHFILLELIAYRDFHEKNFDISYWRTSTGLEVDFILGNAEVAVEVKYSDKLQSKDLNGLKAFCQEHKTAKAFVVTKADKARKIDDSIMLLPYQQFLEDLWAGKIDGRD